ncbi:MAG TPA: LamG-like jellyroll fold domain-containing protein, partial [Verrucomicrobiae bacterium]|nr:LamG-like jellyroll fold domain-containing protein [Verrucomicrobiae bacterium]
MNTRTETKTAYRPVPALVIALAALLAGATLAAAQSGVWTNDASGSWSDTANWLNGVVADGTDATADFSQVDVTALRTVTVDASHVIGSLLFGDSAGVNVDNWTLTPSGGSALTLAVSAGSPTITVNNNAAATNTAWIGVPLAGTTGMTKAGAGMLVLGAENTYSGATAVSAGTLKLTNAAASGTGPVLYLSFDNVNGGIVTNGGSGGSMMNGILVGSGLNVLPGAAPNGRAALSVSNNAVNGGYVLVNSSVVPLNNSGTWSVGMWMKTSTTGAVYAYQGDGGWGNGNTTFHLNGGTNDQAGAFAGGVRWGQGWETGTSNLTDGNWHFVVMTCANGTRTSYVDGNVDAWMVINGNTMNQWSGNGAGGQLWLGGTADLADGDMPLNGEIAEVYVYNRALSQAEVQGLMTAVGPSPQPSILPVSAVSVAAGSKLDLDGVSATVAGLTGSGAVDSTLAGGSATLTIDSSSNPTFAGLITNSVGIVNVIVNGTGALTLAGANGYAGNTWLANGTLDVNAPAALGAGTGGRLLIGGGALDNTSGATVTLSANKPQTWYGDFTFNGTTNLNLGSGAVTLSGPGSTRLVTVDSNLFAVGPLNTYVAGMGLTKAGAGTLLLGGSGASGMQGLLTIAGGTVQMAQDINSIPGLSGTGTLETSGTGVNKWLWINGSTNSTFSGALINYPGTTGRGMGLNKNGTGALTLNGTVTINDTITVQNGALNLAGNGVAITNYNASGDVLSIGTLAGGRAVLTLSGGATLLANYTPAPPYT